MADDRESKVSSLLEELVATFIRNEASTNPLITVTHVTISRDLKNATVFVTTIPDDREDDALIFLKRKGSDLRTFVKKNASFRYLPYFTFEIDRGERHRQHMDEVVNEIHQDEAERKG